MVMLEARAVSVTLGGRRIVAGADLVAPAGTLTAIVGPNGSGKTTLFRALCGDIRYGGEIRLHGCELSALGSVALAARRAVLPQSSVLAFPFTVREVVAMGARTGYAGLPEADVSRLPEAALQQVDLAGFGGRYYGELSGGEQQRVQLARVLCQAWLPVVDGRSRLLMMDEPVSSLDIRHQLTVMEVARRYADEGGTVLCVLHDLNLVSLFADEVHALRNGSIVRSGAPRDVIDDALMREVFESPIAVRNEGGRAFVLPGRLALNA